MAELQHMSKIVMKNNIMLNLGCGTDYREGFVNIDRSDTVSPDLVLNLGHEPLPFPDDSVVYVYAKHFFEHLDTEEIDFLVKELYRVCRHGAVIDVVCPHYLSPSSCAVHHKQRISENFFNVYSVDKRKGTGDSKWFFKISYRMDFMRYNPKRSGVLRFLPFLAIVPCNIFFSRLEVVKE